MDISGWFCLSFSVPQIFPLAVEAGRGETERGTQGQVSRKTRQAGRPLSGALEWHEGRGSGEQALVWVSLVGLAAMASERDPKRWGPVY